MPEQLPQNVGALTATGCPTPLPSSALLRLLNSPVELLSSCKMQNAKILAIKKKTQAVERARGKWEMGNPVDRCTQ